MRLDQVARLEDGAPERERFPHTLTVTENDNDDVIVDMEDIIDKSHKLYLELCNFCWRGFEYADETMIKIKTVRAQGKTEVHLQ